MSILIKGMEMPMYWYECPFCSDGYCFMIQDGDDRICLVGSKEDTHRNENCPLIELPPHGRLIDADALAKDRWKLFRNVIEPEISYFQQKQLNDPDIPTIIEAEGGDAQ